MSLSTYDPTPTQRQLDLRASLRRSADRAFRLQLTIALALLLIAVSGFAFGFYVKPLVCYAPNATQEFCK